MIWVWCGVADESLMCLQTIANKLLTDKAAELCLANS